MTTELLHCHNAYNSLSSLENLSFNQTFPPWCIHLSVDKFNIIQCILILKLLNHFVWVFEKNFAIEIFVLFLYNYELLVSLHFPLPLQDQGSGTIVVNYQVIWQERTLQQMQHCFGDPLHSHIQSGHLIVLCFTQHQS